MSALTSLTVTTKGHFVMNAQSPGAVACRNMGPLDAADHAGLDPRLRNVASLTCTGATTRNTFAAASHCAA